MRLFLLQVTCRKSTPNSIGSLLYLIQRLMDLCWTKRNWDNILSELFSFPLSILFHRGFILIHHKRDIQRVRWWPQFRQSPTPLTWTKTWLVSILSGYRLDDRVSVPSRGKVFSSSLCFQTWCEAHPISSQWVRGGLFPGVNCGLCVTLTFYLTRMPRLGMSRSYNSSALGSCMACKGTTLLIFTIAGLSAFVP
jgi:hypothetical protein